MSYLFETHSHTMEASPCSYVGAADVVKEYCNKGYTGLIVTDHVGDWGFSGVYGTWKDKVDNLLKAYYLARDEGDRLGVSVLFGMEIALNRPYRDYLIYGFNESLLYKHENIQNYNQKDLYQLCESEGALLFAAHPFRGVGSPPDAKYLHGAEVFNANPRHNSKNGKAETWAKSNDLLEIAGSDYHESGDASAGVWLKKRPASISEFAEIIKSGDNTMKML